MKTRISTNSNTKRNERTVISRLFVFVFVAISVFLVFSVEASEKNWVGAGDATSWEDPQNWFPSSVPNSTDDTTIDLKDASVTANKTFESKLLNIGGAATSSFITENFIQGNIAPASSSDDALYIRKGGAVTLKGAGTMTLKGRFKNSEETLAGEESFMFTIE